jgi:hypothetical protein
MKYYQLSTNGFYDDTIHTAIPSDAVEITDNEYDLLLLGRLSGGNIELDAIGRPVLIAQPAPTVDQIRANMKCTAYQIRQALSTVGLRDLVEAAVGAGDQALQDAWHYAQTFERMHPKIVQIGVALGQTDAQMDDLFTLAMTLQP